VYKPCHLAELHLDPDVGGLPLTDVIEDHTHTALEGMGNDVLINWARCPLGPDKITVDGRAQRPSFGFNI